MSVLVFDNYDSFTYNLVHLLREIGVAELDVYRNDQIELSAIDRYDKILISPGPGIPEEAGILPDLIKAYAEKKSIFGVCLGHQAIAEAFGGTLLNMSTVVHGKPSDVLVRDTNEVLFSGLPERFAAARYHSWLVATENLPSCLRVTAETESGEIMALTHSEYDVRGVQFHPESVLTEVGAQIVRNWLSE